MDCTACGTPLDPALAAAGNHTHPGCKPTEGHEGGPDQIVFTNGAGKPVQASAFRDACRAAVMTAGLPEGTRFHDLRHYYASALIRANLNPKVIQARLGHASITETMDTYDHLFPDAGGLGRGVFDALFPDVHVDALCTGSEGR